MPAWGGVALDFTTVELATGPVRVATLGSGSPVLYLHGAAGLRVGPALEALAAHHRLVMPTLPGFDGTPPHEGLDGAGGPADLGAALAAWAGAPCRIVGHGSGGRVAAWTAIAHPEAVDLLVLDAPAGFGAVPEAADGGADGGDAGASGRGGEGAVDAALLARLGEISALTLILAGTEDAPGAVDCLRSVHRAIGGSHLCFVYGAGADIAADRPQQWSRVVDDFLADGASFVVNRARR